MAMQLKQRVTLDAFEAFVERPENTEKLFELISGEIVEVPSNPFVSVIASRIITFIGMFLMQNALEGHVTGEGGGFIINGQVFAPDVAYMRHLPTNQGFEQQPPLLAVEVLSNPHNNTEQSDLRRKLAHYRRVDVWVWVVDYVDKRVEVHIPGEAVMIYDEGMTLDGGEVLPGFKLAVKDIFPKA